MIFLPIVERELRLAARRRSTYWARLAAAVGAILISMWVLGTMRDFTSASADGAGLFHTLSWFALIYFLLAGLRVTAIA